MQCTRSFTALPSLAESDDENYPNTEEHFFTIPSDDWTSSDLAEHFADIAGGRVLVYLFVVVKYRDAALGAFYGKGVRNLRVFCKRKSRCSASLWPEPGLRCERITVINRQDSTRDR
jgi:hypothetical protein